MAQRKRSRRPSKQRKQGQSQGSLPRENGISELRLGTALGELPFVRPYADAAAKAAKYVERTDYSEMLNDVASLARGNPAATLTLGMAAGLLIAQLARRRPKGRSEHNGNSTAGRRSQKQHG